MSTLLEACVAHYKMNDCARNKTVADSRETSNGTAQRNTNLLSVDGKVGGALQFDGSSDYVDTNKTFQDTFRDSFTMSLWVKPTDGRPPEIQRFLCHEYDDESTPYGINDVSISLGIDGRIFATYFAKDKSLYAYFEDVLPNGVNPWIMITVVITKLAPSIAKLELYRNGIMQHYIDDTGIRSDIEMTDYTNPVSLPLGAEIYDYGNGPIVNQFFSGLLDNVMIFNRALTAVEITYLYNAGAGSETLEDVPVLENIAENIKQTINGITIAAGYKQTLTARRCKSYKNAPPAEGEVLIAQDETPEETDAQAVGCCDIDQKFYLIVDVMGEDTETNLLDTRRNQIYADIKKALMADHTRGHYAIDTHVLPQADFQVENETESVTGVVAPVVVTYRTQYDNPYA